MSSDILAILVDAKERNRVVTIHTPTLIVTGTVISVSGELVTIECLFTKGPIHVTVHHIAAVSGG